MTHPSGREDYRSLRSGELADAMDLGDFFEALGPVMRLPPKDGEPPDPPRSSRMGGSSRRTTVLATIALSLIAVSVSAPAVLRALRTSDTVPAGLHGVWTTVAERYAGRSFELSDAGVRLGLGGEDVYYPIASVQTRDSADAAIHTIRYRDGDAELDFALAIGPDSVAVLRHLPDVGWRRVVR